MMVASAHIPPPSFHELSSAQQQQQSGAASAIVATGGEVVPVGLPAAVKKPFLAVIGGLLAEPSARVQHEACLALEPLAADHRVAMCQAQVVGALIALTQVADDDALVTAASRVLKMLA